METETVQQIPLEQIEEDPNQPRRSPDQGAIQALASSLAGPAGMIQPVILRPKVAPDPVARVVPNRYWIVAGHRRVLAARIRDWKSVPAIVRDLNTKAARMAQVIENLQREDLDAIEEARGFDSLVTLGWTQEEVATFANRSQAYISHTVRLLKLPGFLQEAISAGTITARHGRGLFSLLDYPRILEAVGRYILKTSRQPGGELHLRAEDIERNLDYQISRAAAGLARPLTHYAAWGPKNPLGGSGCLFTPGDAVPIKRLTPVLQKEATAPGVFYHPGPCTKCPHSYGLKGGGGLCLEPGAGKPSGPRPGVCYDIRQRNAATVTKARELAIPGRIETKRARAAMVKKQDLKRKRWGLAVTKARTLFRRRRARPAGIFLRILYALATDYPSRDWIPRVLGADLKDHKGGQVAFRRDPFPYLKRLPAKRLEEILQTALAIEDASKRRWRSSWPFKPPAIKGLGEW